MPITGFVGQVITIDRQVATSDNSRAAKRTRARLPEPGDSASIKRFLARAAGEVVPAGMRLEFTAFVIPPRGEQGLFIATPRVDPTGENENVWARAVFLENAPAAGAGFEWPNFSAGLPGNLFNAPVDSFVHHVADWAQFNNYDPGTHSGQWDRAMCDVRALGVMNNRDEFARDDPSALWGFSALTPSFLLGDDTRWGLPMTWLEDFGGAPPNQLFDARKGARLYTYDLVDGLTSSFGKKMCIDYYDKTPVVVNVES